MDNGMGYNCANPFYCVSRAVQSAMKVYGVVSFAWTEDKSAVK